MSTISSLSLEDEQTSFKDIKLISKNNESFTISFEHAKLSEVIQTAFAPNETDPELPVDISSSILKAVIEYLVLCKGEKPPKIDQPLRSKNMAEITTAEQAKFIDSFLEQHSKKELYDLISAANFLQIESLLHLGCAKVAALIKGEPLDKIKDILKIDNKE
jgi:hypothetical protein